MKAEEFAKKNPEKLLLTPFEFAEAYLAHKIEEAERKGPQPVIHDQKVCAGYYAALNKLKEG